MTLPELTREHCITMKNEYLQQKAKEISELESERDKLAGIIATKVFRNICMNFDFSDVQNSLNGTFHVIFNILSRPNEWEPKIEFNYIKINPELLNALGKDSIYYKYKEGMTTIDKRSFSEEVLLVNLKACTILKNQMQSLVSQYQDMDFEFNFKPSHYISYSCSLSHKGYPTLDPLMTQVKDFLTTPFQRTA